MNPLLAWWDAASEPEKKLLAKHARSTYFSVHQAARAYRNKGKLKLSPDFASRLAKASEMVNAKHPHLPVLSQTELSQVCGRCSLAKRCVGA